ncbi:putative oxidoreductase domain-containing protein [Rosellinia necatrix]|uniref:Putative oxidoreductase domain-containing protein n=1 Tax=Rosellinia necatrix TaxID=77044 RepID=A0A1W2TWC6_ROSNE|nr:putative oxidoreductase domain-containing protein [Rosellinia necatrix]
MAQAGQKVFNIGVIGYGLSAKIFQIPFINVTPSFKLHSILQRNPTATSSAPRDHPDLQHFRAVEPFLADASLDVVVLCTSPDTHFALARSALEAGKHVFVEKPFVPTSAEADALIALAASRGLHICVYQNRRWDGDFQTVRRLLSAGEGEGPLGRVFEFETHFDRYRAGPPSTATWKGTLGLAGGGSALYDLGSHLVDQVYALFGMPAGVFAKLSDQRAGRQLGASDPGVEPDGVNMQLAYPGRGGLVVHVRISAVSAEARQPRFWVRGTRGSYRKHGLDPQEDQLKAGMRPGDPGFGLDADECHGRLVTVGEDGAPSAEQVYPNVVPGSYQKIYELFGEALRGNGPVPVPATECRDVLRILEAAKESAMTLREVQLS